MRNAAKILLLAALTTWVYWPCLGGNWLWDDGLEVSQNLALRSPNGWWEPWVHPSGMDYFPLKGSLQWFEWHLWGAHPLGYHLSNLALQVVSALLLWRLLRRLEIPGAYLAALLFAVHPLAVESVAWISEFKNTVSLPLLLVAALAYLRFDRTGSRGAYAGALAAFVAALACKTSVVMFPFVLLLYGWWRQDRVGRREVLRALPFFAASLASGLATVHFQFSRAIGEGGAMPPLPARLADAGWSVLAYARQTVWPSGLAPIYPAHPSGALALLPWLLIAAAIISCLRWHRSWGRPGLLGFGWFLLNLVPVLGILPMSYLRVAPRADHFAYLSLIGLVGLGAAAGTTAVAARRKRLPEPPGAPGIGTAAAALVVAAFALAAHAYAGVFRSQETLWPAAVERNPASWLAHNNLGEVHQRAGATEQARAEFAAAVQLQPSSAEARANLGTALDALGRGGEARGQYRAALQIDPGFAGAHYDLGLSLLKGGRPALAEGEFRAALQREPGRATAHNNLGLSLARQGRLAEAQVEYVAALQLDPGLREAHLNLGNAYFRADHLEDAVTQYRIVLQLDSHHAGAHANLAQALRALGRTSEAEAEAAAAARP